MTKEAAQRSLMRRVALIKAAEGGAGSISDLIQAAIGSINRTYIPGRAPVVMAPLPKPLPKLFAAQNAIKSLVRRDYD